MRIAVLADVHGNLHALRAVADDLRRHGVDAIVNLGDLVSGPFDPADPPHALYAVGERSGAGRAAALRAVPYDHEAAAREAERAGRPAVAHAVRTGRMPAA